MNARPVKWQLLNGCSTSRKHNCSRCFLNKLKWFLENISFKMNISCSVDLSYHSPVVWWNSQSSCVGLLPRSSQTGGKGSWTSRNTAQKSRYRGRCHSPNPGSNLKKKGKRKSDSRRHISFMIVWDFLMCQYTHGQIKESEILLTSEEAFLGVDEMVRGLVHLNLTLPRLGHVPYPGVAGYHVELKNKKMGKTKQILTFEAPCVYATLVSPWMLKEM